MNYVALEQVKATLEMTGFGFADDDLRTAIAAASASVDDHCNRRFSRDATNTVVRYYTPISPGVVWVDDLEELTALATDQDGDGTFETTWVVNTDGVLKPLNAAADGMPYTRFVVTGSSQSLPNWAERSVKVTGRFGWPAVPAEVVEATTILSVRLLRRAREAPFGVVAIGVDGDNVKISNRDPDVVGLLRRYVRELP